MTKNCLTILKNTSPELHDYLRGKAAMDYDESPASKQAYIQAARELQNETLNNLQNVYADLGIGDYKKIAAPESEKLVEQPVSSVEGGEVTEADIENARQEDLSISKKIIASSNSIINYNKRRAESIKADIQKVISGENKAEDLQLFENIAEAMKFTGEDLTKDVYKEFDQLRKDYNIDSLLDKLSEVQKEILAEENNLKKIAESDQRVNEKADAKISKLKSEQSQPKGVSPSSKGSVEGGEVSTKINGIKHDTDSNTTLLPIETDVEKVLPDAESFTKDGFTPKKEFHITAVGFKTGKEIKALLKNATPEQIKAYNDLIASTEWSYTPKNEFYHIEKQYGEEKRESIIQMADVPAMKDFYENLNKIFGTNYAPAPAHVTLMTKGNAMGIGINSQADFESLNPKRIETTTEVVAAKPKIRVSAEQVEQGQPKKSEPVKKLSASLSERLSSIQPKNKENEQPAIAEHSTENELAAKSLTEQDNPEQEPSIKVIESKAESDQKTELTEAVNKSTALVDKATNVVNVPLSDISTNEKEYQGRKNKVSERSAKNVAENFDENKFDPIVLFKHPDGKTYVISGHSRFEGMKRRNAKTIPARYFEGTPAEAKGFAQKSNKFGTLQTDIENAAYYRDKLNKGASYDAVLKEAKENEQEGSAKRIVSLAHLSPTGKTMQAMELLEKGEGDTKAGIVTVAQKIGDIRSKNPHLTDAHENELFDHMVADKENIPTDKEIVEQNNSLNRSIGAVKFNPSDPLNLDRKVVKSAARVQWEQEKDELEKQVSDLKQQVNPSKKTGWTGLKEKAIISLAKGDNSKQAIDQAVADFGANKGGVNVAYQKQLNTKKAELTSVSDKLAKHLLREKGLIEGDKAQQSLFDADISRAAQAEARLKTAKSNYDKAARQLKTAEDKISNKQTTQGSLLRSEGAQGQMFGVDRDEAKSILDPLRQKVKETKSELDAAQIEFNAASNDQLSLFDISNSSLQDGDTKTIGDYVTAAKSVLENLYPNAKLEVYNTTEEYEKAGGPKATRGFAIMGKEGKHRILLNLERISEDKSGKTAIHEVIHPIVYDAFGIDSKRLDEAWRDMAIVMKDVPGMEIVFAHVRNYAASKAAPEGITELLTQIVTGNINIENVPKEKKSKILEILNKILEFFGIDFRFGSAQDFAALAQKIKESFDTSNPESLREVVKQKGIDKFIQEYERLSEKDISPQSRDEILNDFVKEQIAAGESLDDIKEALVDNGLSEDQADRLIDRNTRPKVRVVVGKPSGVDVIEDYEMTTSGEVNNFLSGETIEDVFGESAQGDQQYEVQKLTDMLQDGLNMIKLAMNRWGTDIMDYGIELFQYVQAMSNDANLTNKKAVLLATFLGELKESMLREPSRRGEIQPLYNAVEEYYQRYMNIRGKEVVAGRLLRLYRDKYIGDLFGQRILDERLARVRRSILDAEQSQKIDDAIAEYQKTITKKEKEDQGKAAKNRKQTDKTKQSNKNKLSASDAKQKADAKLEEIKNQAGGNAALIDKIKEAIKKINCK